jgi:hypothetical protein
MKKNDMIIFAFDFDFSRGSENGNILGKREYSSYIKIRKNTIDYTIHLLFKDRD